MSSGYKGSVESYTENSINVLLSGTTTGTYGFNTLISVKVPDGKGIPATTSRDTITSKL